MKIKKLFTITLFCLIATCISKKVNAQNSAPLHFGIGVDAGAALQNPARFVLGADARLQIPLGNSFSGIVTTGYYQYFKTGLYPKIGIVPLKAGLKYFPAKNVYIAGEAGIGFGTEKGQENSFMFSPSVGLAFRHGLDVSLKYEDYTKYNGYASQFALRLAYGFKL